MNPYITFRDTNSNGDLCYYILQRDFPHFVGIISEIPVAEAMCSIPVPGYNLYVVFAGVLRGNYVPAYKGIETEILGIFNSMASWYLVNRIEINSGKYKKFKIQSNDQNRI